jgi:hypothetical protein
MGKFTDYLDTLGAGEDGAFIYPETFHDDLRGAYDADFQGATANAAMLQAEIDRLTVQNTELAAANWNLLQSIPSNTAVAETTDDTETDDDPDDDSDDPDTSDFFKKEND